MREYHIDGFRFDLGHLLDWQTIETIIREARKINPAVVFVCEPWGGGYDPAGFSLRGWGAWNDQIRNGVKGENPFDGQGWMLGKWYGNNNTDRIKSYVNGTLIIDEHGLFQKKEHSVNYLASHDGYTLGDFIRLALKKRMPDEVIKDVDANARISPEELKIHKLAALFLLTSQGMVMIHEGQEYGRSKVIPDTIDVPDSHKGNIDHNSYEKDNATNYLNFHHAKLNKELINYYKGLIQLRNTYPAFRRAFYHDITFFDDLYNEFALGYRLDYEGESFVVLFNASPDHGYDFNLPEGDWKILASPHKSVYTETKLVQKKLNVEPSGGYVLKLTAKEIEK
jgi:pullulanase/glycogen debranching enzyme